MSEHAVERLRREDFREEVRPERAGCAGQQNRVAHVSAPEAGRTNSIQSRR